MVAKVFRSGSIKKILGSEGRSERRRNRIIRACKREILYDARIDWFEILRLLGESVKKFLAPMIVMLIIVTS